MRTPQPPAAAEPAQWQSCPGCHAILYARRVTRNLSVCPLCGHHNRVDARTRIGQLFDAGSVTELPLRADVADDPLDFVDTAPYAQRVRAARAATGLDEALVCVDGTVDGRGVVAAVMDFGFMGGSLGSAVGELFVQCAEHALREQLPLLIVTASGGARMQEGALSLMQMARTSQALADLDAAGLMTIALITDPTFGGVAASFATLCDVLVAEPGARLGFAGARVIKQTIRQDLPAGFQTAEFLLERGLVDLVRPRHELPSLLGSLLAAGDVAARRLDRSRPTRSLRAAEPVVRDPARLDRHERSGAPIPATDAWDAVRTARELGRPAFADYVGHLVDDWTELSGDRIGGDCTAIRGGLGRIAGRPVVVIGHQKGHTLAALNEANFGMAQPAGHRKAMRLLRLAEKLGVPVVTLVDTPGAYPGISAEENGQAVTIAESIRALSRLRVPVVSIITGEGGSGGALALAVADELLMLENAVLSVISPEGCAAILFGDSARAPQAARSLRPQPSDLLELGVIDGVVREPVGGAHTDPLETMKRVKAAVVSSLGRLGALDTDRLLAARHDKIRALGSRPTRPTDLLQEAS